MQIMIDILKEDYEMLKEDRAGINRKEAILWATKNGIVLSEHLGNSITSIFKCKNTPWDETCDLCDIGDLCTEVKQLCK